MLELKSVFTMLYNVANVKVSIKISAIALDIVCKILKEKNIKSKLHNNFVVIKAKYTFIIFKTKNAIENHINITKIPNLFLISVAIKEIEDLLECSHYNLCIDNIIASANLNKNLYLTDIVKSKTFEKVKYNNQKFPGLFVTFNQGTAIIFHSGKIVIVGCQNIEDIEWIIKKISACI